jgi:hypothetical protein
MRGSIRIFFSCTTREALIPKLPKVPRYQVKEGV